MIALTLPWPNPALSPNARMHWRAKAKAVRMARVAARYALLEAADGRRLVTPEGDIEIVFSLYPPDNRQRDRDNAQASLKAYCDGLADALGVDDVRFRTQYDWYQPEPSRRGIYIALPGVQTFSRSRAGTGELDG